MKTRIYHTNNEIMYSCHYQVVWCPKYRRKVLVDKIKARLKEVIEKTCTEQNIGIIKMDIFPDHIILHLDVDPRVGIHKVVKLLKAESARVLRQEFSELKTKLPTLWSNSYLVSTFGDLPEKEIAEYISSQKTSQRQ